MVNIDQPVVSDTSHMLRDILQTKEKRFQEMEKEQVSPIMANSNSYESENIVTGNDVSGDHSGRSDQDSMGGSDNESSFLEQSRVDETEVDDVKSDVDENGSNDVHSTSESKKAKRARVDNIISSMQHPAQYIDADSIYGSEVRRQKRKQNIPQQHESIPKSRKLDNPPNEEDLWNLRHQLFAVQNYFKQQQEDTLHRQMNGFPAMENIHRIHQAYFANLSNRHNERIPSPPPKLPTYQFKDTKINTDHFNIEEHVRESVNANKVGDLDDKELDELIVNLKSKIEEAVSLTVDKELAKFFQKRAPKEAQQLIERLPKEDKVGHHQDSRRSEPEKKPTNHSLDHILQLPEKASVNNNNNNGFRLPERQSAFELPKLGGGFSDLARPPFPHPTPLGYPPLSFYLPSNLHPPSLYSCPIVPPEQTEALSLVVSTPKKKRTKVTDTRLSPRAARALLNDNGTLGSMFDHHDRPLSTAGLSHMGHCLPTSVAIPNPSLQHSDLMNFYREQALCGSPTENERNTPCSSNSPSDGGYGSYLKHEFFNDSDEYDAQGKQITDTLTPMHLRKAKLMFFYVRYPSSAILKVYFPDVQFKKNNTAQLVKWFSNFREFYYIQMEKYARQAIAEGCKHAEELVVTTDSELYRVLNLHYNRNNQIEVPENFRIGIQATLREFFNAVSAGKDSEPSWKKPIYKVIARLDDAIPEYFKSPNWMEQLGDA